MAAAWPVPKMFRWRPGRLVNDGAAMKDKNGVQQDYFGFLFRRNWATWITAGLLTLGMNVLLITLLPGLLQPTASTPEFDSVIPRVNMVRIRPKDTLLKKRVRTPRKPEPEKKPPEPTRRHVEKERLRLPFEMNVEMPGGPTDIKVPTAVAGLEDLDLKNIFSVGELDKPLVTLSRMPPMYPMHAKRKGIQGWVKVEFIINEKGRTESPTIIEAQPPGVFKESVMRCVSGWRFEPGTVDGVSVKVQAETVVQFELE